MKTIVILTLVFIYSCEKLEVAFLNLTSNYTTRNYLSNSIFNSFNTNLENHKSETLQKLIKYNNTIYEKYLRSEFTEPKYTDLLFLEVSFSLINKTVLDNLSKINSKTIDFSKSSFKLKFYWFLPEGSEFEKYKNNKTFFAGFSFTNITYQEENNFYTAKLFNDAKICKWNIFKKLKKCEDYFFSFKTNTNEILSLTNQSDIFTDMIKTNFNPKLDYGNGGLDSIISTSIEEVNTKYISPFKNLIEVEINIPMFSLTKSYDSELIETISIENFREIYENYSLFGSNTDDIYDINFDFLNNITVFYGMIDVELKQEVKTQDNIKGNLISVEDNNNVIIKYNVDQIHNIVIDEIFNFSSRFNKVIIYFALIHFLLN